MLHMTLCIRSNRYNPYLQVAHNISIPRVNKRTREDIIVPFYVCTLNVHSIRFIKPIVVIVTLVCTNTISVYYYWTYYFQSNC